MVVVLIQAATVAVVCAAVAIGGWVHAPRRAAREAGKLTHKSGLTLDDTLAPLVLRRLRRRVRGTMLGMGVGVLVGCAGIVVIGDFTRGLPWFVLCDLVGAGVAALIVHVAETSRVRRELGSRAALLRPRRLTDFLHPLEIAAPYAGLIFPAAIVAYAVASGNDTGLLATCGALAVAVTVAAIAAQRFVLRMAPPADSSTRVMWEDMLRVVALRDCGVTAYGLSLTFAWLPFLIASSRNHGTVGPLMWLSLALFLVSVTGLLAIAFLAEYSPTGKTRFLQRLYADEVAPR